MLKEIRRGALDAYLKLARKPIDTAAKRFGEGAEIGVDRFDAGVRDVAGRLLFDDELRDEARRRRVAANEREEALRLKGKAEAVRDDAQETAQRRKAQAAKVARSQQERIDSEARRDRLEALDAKHEALSEAADATVAREEAQRLRKAAGRTKAKRTSGTRR
jgi:hypothetical protein